MLLYSFNLIFLNLVQSFSWGINGPYNSSSLGKSGGPYHPTDPTDPLPSKWSTIDVIDWLKKNGLDKPEVVKWISDEEVDGIALISLTEALLKEHGIKPFGYRARLLKAIEPLAIRDSQLGLGATEITWQDMQVSAQFTISADAMLMYFSGKKSIYEASLSIYHSSTNRYGRPSPWSEDFASGDPLLQYDFVKPGINGYQISGSQGNLEQMYVSMQVSFDAILIHTCATSESHSFGLNLTRSMLGLAPVSSEEVGEHKDKRLWAGTTTFISQFKKTPPWQQRWGREISWSKEMHRYFPRLFRQAVRTLLLIRNRKENVFSSMPRDAMMLLFSIMSVDANPSPFHPYPFPFLAPGEDNDNAGGGW